MSKLRQCRTELAAQKVCHRILSCSDKTLEDMCAKCPVDLDCRRSWVYAMGAQKIESYLGARFTQKLSQGF